MTQMLSGNLKGFIWGDAEDSNYAGADGKKTQESKGMPRKEYKEHQKQHVKEKWVNCDPWMKYLQHGWQNIWLVKHNR